MSDSRDLHAVRAAAHAPGALIPVSDANHFTIVRELRDADGELTRQVLQLVVSERRRMVKVRSLMEIAPSLRFS